jgi:chromosome segregation ATPase
LDIENGLDKIEALVRTLREECDKAREEAESRKRALDERELELLQTEEELQELRRTSTEQLDASRREREDLESRLAEVALRLNNLLPLVMKYSDEAQNAPESQYDGT